MGQPKLKSLLVLIVLFSMSALLVHARSEAPLPEKSQSLISILKQIPEWTYVRSNVLDKKIVRFLHLDDYVNAVYTNGTEKVSLYIGYYLGSEKVGAAHDPLVCFPGQGWTISGQKSFNITLSEDSEVNGSMLIAEMGNHSELVFYWFQAYDTTNPGTFRQKIALLWKKLMGHGQDNAFVRVTASLDELTLSNQKEVIVNFISSFYPKLMQYVHDGNDGSQTSP